LKVEFSKNKEGGILLALGITDAPSLYQARASDCGAEMTQDLKPHNRRLPPAILRLSSHRAPQRVNCGLVKLAALLATISIVPAGIFPGVKAAAGQDSSKQESGGQVAQAPFKLQVQRNMVLVRVVVRDSNGRPVSGLRKEDFQLFDNNKPQQIDQFDVESTAAAPAAAPQAPGQPPQTNTAPAPAPSNFQAIYFDDVEMELQEIVAARAAADRYLAAKLTPEDRAGIFTSSGQNVLDFTVDDAKIHEALAKLRPRSTLAIDQHACPNIGVYQAQLIEQHDTQAVEIAAFEDAQCNCRGVASPDCTDLTYQSAHLEIEARKVLLQWEIQFMTVLRGLEQVIRRMAVLPGKRSVIFVSPGFLTYDMERQLDQVTERALRSDVVVNTLDSRGLNVIVPGGDVSQQSLVVPMDPALSGRKAQMIQTGMALNAEVLHNLAADTGGKFFHNSNDLDEGFRQVGALTEVAYVLAFSPPNLKFDGRYHQLKVQLANPAHCTIQARRGYFAPRKGA
jgi:VWFA-related protein